MGKMTTILKANISVEKEIPIAVLPTINNRKHFFVCDCDFIILYMIDGVKFYYF